MEARWRKRVDGLNVYDGRPFAETVRQLYLHDCRHFARDFRELLTRRERLTLARRALTFRLRLFLHEMAHTTLASRFYQWAKALPRGGVREVAPNLYVCSPLILPPFGSKTRRRLNRRALLPLVRRTVKNLGFDPEVIWTFLPTDTVASLVKMLRTARARPTNATRGPEPSSGRAVC